MTPVLWPRLCVAVVLTMSGTSAIAVDPRLREVTYDAKAVVAVLVKRGVVTHVLLDPDEAITDVASGLGSDCAKPEAAWCVAAQAGGRNLFVKAKTGASGPNNLAVVTDRRTHSFVFEVLPDSDPRAPVYRLVVSTPVVRPVIAAAPPTRETPSSLLPPPPSQAEVVAERLRAAPMIVNSDYSIAEGAVSEGIVPTLAFDDGRFTYFRFPGNREVPAVFHVLADGSETLVNTRMEDDLLVVDRVSPQLVLRSGSAVVAVRNDAFDLDGLPPTKGASVPGIERLVKSEGVAPGRVRLQQPIAP